MRSVGMLLSLVVWCGFPLPTFAGSVADTVTSWGLAGMWAVTCKKSAGDSLEATLSYRVKKDGTASIDRDFGDRRDSSEILSADVSPEGLLTIVADYKAIVVEGKTVAQRRRTIFLRGSDGRIRALSNLAIAGEKLPNVTVENGKFTHNGDDTPWQTRCQ